MDPRQLSILAGIDGLTVVNDTNQTLPPLGYSWSGFLVRADATISKIEIEGTDATDIAKLIALPFPAGTVIPGIITNIQLTSGDIVLFKLKL